ncbi:hypothetical protein B5M09_003754 [Aphanomyces astaci]|uniref:Pentacotripeptide-repeat region of PRORP domain-containing protein n=1 Tax=Aphanomyces astaci TaxID=112090 RepID=A0A3R7WZ60_APHAT|nr:hypothetical protein B5M09_003754 [Aphanomyces astaci]
MLSRVLASSRVSVASTCVRGFAVSAAAAPVKVQRPKHTGPPTLQSTAAEVQYLGTVYSIAASSNHLTKAKLEFIVREAKSEKDLPLAREALELYERNFLLIPTHCTGTFVSKCIKHNQADLALQWLRDSKFLSKHIVNGTFSRLIDHYSAAGDVDKAVEVFGIAKKHNIEITAKVYTSLIKYTRSFISMRWCVDCVLSCSLGKANGKIDLAVDYALQAGHAKMINSHGVLLLLRDLPEHDLRDLVRILSCELTSLLEQYDESAAPASAAAPEADEEGDEEQVVAEADESDKEEDGDAKKDA